MSTIRVAVIQDSPVFFDKQASLEKLEALALQAAKDHPQLILFPEAFIPGYPRGLDFGTVIGSRTDEGRALFRAYYEASLDLDSPDKTFLEDLSNRVGAYLVVGASERQRHHGSLFCSMIYISPTTGLLGVHRKIKPTGQERVIWSEADGSSLITVDTDLGILGGLICWENYMPLARMAMYRRGVQIYLAPTADARDSWTTSMQHLALEGRCFVLSANQFIESSDYPAKYLAALADPEAGNCRGGSLIIAPDGCILQGPLFGRTGILVADLDTNMLAEQKLDFDPSGHYNRADIFKFDVHQQPPTINDRHQ